MSLPLAPGLRFGFMASVAGADAARATAGRAEAFGDDSLWTGAHVACAVPILADGWISYVVGPERFAKWVRPLVGGAGRA